MPEKFFLTTPLYYVNAEPHIGSAYTTIAADAICRYWQMAGVKTLMLTGVDEHGGKIENTAEARGIKPQEHCDEITEKFKELWACLNIDFQKFSRTSGEKHNKVVEAFFKRVHTKGDIYEANYEGLYCLACEDFKNERELLPGQLCPTHHTKVQNYSEKNYFFALSKYSDKLKKFFKDNPDFIQPRFRQNEVNSWIDEGLKDFPISRSSVKWGIPVPGDENQTIYVWFDALLGYLSPLLEEEVVFSKDFDQEDNLAKEVAKLEFWPADLHLIGKDILRFHAVYWIAMLMSAEFPLPKQLFGHGFLTKDGEKMGKTRGNIIVPHELIDKYGVDAVRFYFLFSIPFGQDGDFTEKSFIETLNAYLANRLGNLFSRVLKLVQTNCEGKVPDLKLDSSSPIATAAVQLADKVEKHLKNYELHLALTAIFDFVDQMNLNMTELKPWNLVKSEKPEDLHTAKLCLLETLEGLRIVANLIYPFIPAMAEKMLSVFAETLDKNPQNAYKTVRKWAQLKSETLLNDPGILFNRIK
ncbi:MAG: methionine--tRNA ligase [Candidatus Caenarcaniphilales bacterium]|nr:methionine--tRNA ligase [Candidatus Caenarcaniphilales bacterium]